MSEPTCDAPALPNEAALPVASTERLPTGRFAPGHANLSPGRPKGSRSRATLLGESMMHDDTAEIFGKILSRAKKGNMAALKFCAERIVPRMTSRPVDVELPPVATLDDVDAALAVVVAAMGRGEVSPEQAKTMSTVLDQRRRSLESRLFEVRITAMEDHMAQALRFTGGKQR